MKIVIGSDWLAQTDFEDRCRTSSGGAHGCHLDVCRNCLCFWVSVGSYQHGHHCVGGGCPDNILPSKRHYLVGHRILAQPLWTAAAGLLASGKSAGLEVCHTGFGLWIRPHNADKRKQPAG